MNSSLLWKAILALLLLSSAIAQTSHTRLTFFVEYEVQSDEDYLEMTILVKAEDTSLKTSLAEAADAVAFVRNEAQQYCKSNSKKGGQCHEISESGKFKVQPIYRTIRGQPVFIGFLTSYEVTAKVLHPANLGQLVDKINRREGVSIETLEWKDAEEQDYELLAIDQGIQEAQKRCKNMGGALEEIESVEQVPNFEEEQKPAEEEEQEQQQEQTQPEIIKFKFVVKCLSKQKKQK